MVICAQIQKIFLRINRSFFKKSASREKWELQIFLIYLERDSFSCVSGRLFMMELFGG